MNLTKSPIVSRWSDESAAACMAECREHGEALALRVYTSRLLGQDPRPGPSVRAIGRSIQSRSA